MKKLDKKHVVIVGGGFGGLEAAKILGRCSELHVTIIDRRNHHLFQPLLYQVAMAGLSPADIATPIRSLVAQFKNTTVLLGDVQTIDLKNQSLQADFGSLHFDYLILACGATHSYFGRSDWEKFAPGLKSLEQATEIRRRVLMSFELAERETDPKKRDALLTIVVVGGGPTGVELAGSLGEITQHTLGKEFKHIEPKNTEIILIEADRRILIGFDESLSKRAVKDLKKLGVQVRTGLRVTDINEHGVALGDKFISARTVIWAAGVKPAAINETLGVPLDPEGRILVQEDLSIPSHPNSFSVGDQIRFNDRNGKPLPGQAPAAMQQGRHVARNILRLLNGSKTSPFRYLDKGQMATIGRRKAVLEFRSLRMAGALAWWGWLLVHIYYLIGFKNRLFVFIQWGFAYITWRRGARLVTNPPAQATSEWKEDSRNAPNNK